MWALSASRKVLLDILGRQPLPPLEDIVDLEHSPMHSSHEELLLLWASKPEPSPSGLNREQLPDAILVWPQQMREFIAWITTVVSGYRPFTAFVRVIDRERAQDYLNPKVPSFGKLEDAIAGVILAEALTLSGPQRSVSGLSLRPCESTYSYSFARALALGYVRNGLDPVAAPFATARKLTRQLPRRVGDEAISLTLKVLSGLAADETHSERPSGVPAFIWESCRELQVEREVKRSWRLLTDAALISPQLLNELRGSREQRVKAFERILQNPSGLDPLTASFLAGLLTDQVGPGSFEHIELLLPYVDRYPTALLWYGLCAGLHPDSEVQQVGNCLGRRLVRDLLAVDAILSRPKYDIAIGELEVHLDREEPLDFRAASQNHIEVELLPGVPAYMKWPITSEYTIVSPKVSTASGRQSELPLSSFVEANNSEVLAERQAAIDELLRAADRVKSTYADQDYKANFINKVGSSKRRKK